MFRRRDIALIFIIALFGALLTTLASAPPTFTLDGWFVTDAEAQKRLCEERSQPGGIVGLCCGGCCDFRGTGSPNGALTGGSKCDHYRDISTGIEYAFSEGTVGQDTGWIREVNPTPTVTVTPTKTATPTPTATATLTPTPAVTSTP